MLVFRCFSVLLLSLLTGSALGADYPPSFPAATPHAAPISEPIPASIAPPASLPAPATGNNQGGEVHIVIDTSGSMKKTDPKNLRVPSLKLLVNLLPTGSRGGVWLFDATPVLISPVGVINEQWKQQATRNAHNIHSRGLFTDIEAAISASSKEWLQSPEPSGHRHLILLTDGMVDVSKNAEESAASHRRIINELVPSLQKAGVQVYTIALSELADQDLMRSLAVQSGGWFEMADNAEQLQRAFVALFNKTSRQDTVPLKGNRFNIDASIEECTVLAMLRPNAPPVSLSMPNGKRVSLRQHHENVSWLHEAGFDLITITKPDVGTWTLHGDIDPANQVMVVTHLKMEQAPPLDNFIPEGNAPDIAVRFTENGAAIQEESFLTMMTVHAELKKGDTAQEMDLLKLDSASGLFKADLKTEIAPGEYTLQIAADGRTFQRAIEQKFSVLGNVFQVETQDIIENGSPMLLLTLIPDKSISPDSLSIAATLVVQTQQSIDLIPMRMGNGWQIKLHAPAPNDHWLINFNVKQKTTDGKGTSLYMKPLRIDGKPVVAPLPPPVAETIIAPPAPPEPPQNQARGWQISGLLAIGINLLAGGIVWWWYKRSQRKQKAESDSLLDHLA